MLEYKAQRYGRTFVKIGRFEPTSQVLGLRPSDGPKPLDVREWTCPACNTLHDRDLSRHSAKKQDVMEIPLLARAA